MAASSPHPSGPANAIASELPRETRSESRSFDSLPNPSPNLSLMASMMVRFSANNRRWYEYTGTTLEQMEGWGWQSVHDPIELPRVVEGWQHSIRTGTPFEMEFPLKAADGGFRWFLTGVSPIRDDGGTIVLWFGTHTYID